MENVCVDNENRGVGDMPGDIPDSGAENICMDIQPSEVVSESSRNTEAVNVHISNENSKVESEAIQDTEAVNDEKHINNENSGVASEANQDIEMEKDGTSNRITEDALESNDDSIFSNSCSSISSYMDSSCSDDVIEVIRNEAPIEISSDGEELELENNKESATPTAVTTIRNRPKMYIKKRAGEPLSNTTKKSNEKDHGDLLTENKVEADAQNDKKRTLFHEHFIYILDFQHKNKAFWNCIHRPNGCRAIAITIDSEIVSIIDQHCHNHDQ
ncbi:uncharacterized protein LOC113519049 [Galleria mellonella]|uniref:Uncharacterized protein LOC113519049 n=1 Tax=Galleria mellonella TaxID=7137 RepID=A0ABM3MAW5_GALME|nr:uncharacterized protein LOC113519049 [Galleria mellonella]XP_052748556.1 uncharacterized protein LOC113519049 [Galleria mellonella]XP_052748557.1 uncharacterized protein LOC113519049 [Galleria mellonella]